MTQILIKDREVKTDKCEALFITIYMIGSMVTCSERKQRKKTAAFTDNDCVVTRLNGTIKFDVECCVQN